MWVMSRIMSSKQRFAFVGQLAWSLMWIDVALKRKKWCHTSDRQSRIQLTQTMIAFVHVISERHWRSGSVIRTVIFNVLLSDQLFFFFPMVLRLYQIIKVFATLAACRDQLISWKNLPEAREERNDQKKSLEKSFKFHVRLSIAMLRKPTNNYSSRIWDLRIIWAFQFNWEPRNEILEMLGFGFKT